MTNDEIRNSKLESNSKFQCSNVQNTRNRERFEHSIFEHWNLIRVSNFEFRHLFLLLCLFLIACNQPKPTATIPLAPPAPPDPILAATDPGALRMQDIAAVMTAYLHVNQDMPLSLSWLKPTAARFGTTLDFTSPISGKPYIYVPNGLTIPGIPHHLVLYDATPSHGGHWAVMILPAQATQPLQAEVFHLTPDMLQLYLK